jgi:hypothetical protein
MDLTKKSCLSTRHAPYLNHSSICHQDHKHPNQVKMKFFSFPTLVAFVAMIATTTHAADATVDDPVEFVEGPGFTRDMNETRVLRSEVGLTVGQAGDLAVATFQIAGAITPLLSEMFKKKECRQIACWVATSTENCGMTAANQVQRELMRGRNAFSVESTGPSGMWVRYWRTQFTPPDRGDVADGTCGAGTKFVVTNCQMAGKVYC